MHKELNQTKSNFVAGEILQKQLQSGEYELKLKCEELNYKISANVQLEKDISEYKFKVSQYEAEKLFMQREIIKFKQEISDKKETEKSRGEI